MDLPPRWPGPACHPRSSPPLVTLSGRNASNGHVGAMPGDLHENPDMFQQSKASAAGMHTDRSQDMALVARARKGDAVAFETIMRQHNRLLLRCARGVVDDEAEAQDVVQEAYLRAFSR